MTDAPPLLVVAGATATGKTGLAIRLTLALRDDGIRTEVISADSLQVYRGLDIGTAKPTLDERRGVPHHGLDLVDPDQLFSVVDFADHVAAVLPPLATAGGLAILAGGTGFYLRAIANGLDTKGLPSDSAVRSKIEARMAEFGVAAGAARLRSLAPNLAARTDLQNPRRVARALEIAEIAGDAPLPEALGYPAPVAWLGLDVPRDVHARWIAARARAQFDAGLVEEARALRERYDPALRSFSAIGYREAWDLLDGRIDREGYLAANVGRNVAYARRQRTWFRATPADLVLEAGDPAAADVAL